MNKKLLTLMAVLAASTQLVRAADQWQELFDGKTLTGWIQRGGKANYVVEDGSIVGTTVKGTPNSFMCTKKNYCDFILELDYKVNPELNSGVQIRSECFDKKKTVELGGKKIEIAAGRVHGYQVEIDPSPRAYSGGIYEEGRRGWLNDLKKNEPARKAFKQNDWNHYRIEANGDSIKTWINGVPAADLKDSVTPCGFIGLQVHAHKEAGLQVRFKNIRIQDLGNAK